MRYLFTLILFISCTTVQSTPQYQVRALITPSQQATLSAPLTDEIHQISVKESEAFQQGEILIHFKCDTVQKQIEKAKAELDIHRRTLQSHMKMREMQSISELEVDVTAARTRQAEAELTIMQIEAERCQIIAPFNGRITKRHAHPFELVKRGAKLLDIINHQTLIVELHIPSNWLQWITVGTPFTLSIDETGKKIDASVSTIGSEINPVSQTIKVKGSLILADNQLISGMSGIAQFSPQPPH